MRSSHNSLAVVLEKPEHVALAQLDLKTATDNDVVVDVNWSGISTGTEKLLWSGQMPHFPGMGYPLVPGYESVGTISYAGKQSGRKAGETVFVPGAHCFSEEVRSLFGGTASKLVVPSDRALPIAESIQEKGILLALAATAYHALTGGQAQPPSAENDWTSHAGPILIVGHGVLGRLLARLAVTFGYEPPVVWERNPKRQTGCTGYEVIEPEEDNYRNYQQIYDVSGDASILDELISRLSREGEIILAGFYSKPISFAFPPAFMKEAKLRISAEWQDKDLQNVKTLVEQNRLSLDGLITHCQPATAAINAYYTAFHDADCLKMILDWRQNL